MLEQLNIRPPRLPSLASLALVVPFLIVLMPGSLDSVHAFWAPIKAGNPTDIITGVAVLAVTCALAYMLLRRAFAYEVFSGTWDEFLGNPETGEIVQAEPGLYWRSPFRSWLGKRGLRLFTIKTDQFCYRIGPHGLMILQDHAILFNGEAERIYAAFKKLGEEKPTLPATIRRILDSFENPKPEDPKARHRKLFTFFDASPEQHPS